MTPEIRTLWRGRGRLGCPKWPNKIGHHLLTRAIITRGLYTFWSSFMYCDLWPYVWLVFKSGFKSRAGYSGARMYVPLKKEIFPRGHLRSTTKLTHVRLPLRHKISKTRTSPVVRDKILLLNYLLNYVIMRLSSWHI